MTDGSPRIFLSYAQDRGPFVRAVASELRSKGVDPGFDRAELQSGVAWQESLAAALASSELVVVFLDDAVESPWLNFEIGAAVGGSKPVVPVYLSQSGRDRAPGVITKHAGIDAADLKPDQVADRIAEVLAAV